MHVEPLPPPAHHTSDRPHPSLSMRAAWSASASTGASAPSRVGQNHPPMAAGDHEGRPPPHTHASQPHPLRFGAETATKIDSKCWEGSQQPQGGYRHTIHGTNARGAGRHGPLPHLHPTPALSTCEPAPCRVAGATAAGLSREKFRRVAEQQL